MVPLTVSIGLPVKLIISDKISTCNGGIEGEGGDNEEMLEVPPAAFSPVTTLPLRHTDTRVHTLDFQPM